MADQENKDQGKLHIDADWKAQARAEKQRMSEQPAKKEQPKIHVDQDWKSQARAEKERLARESTEAAGAAEQRRGMPAADFQTLVSTMATQALFAMGAIPDPNTGQRMVHLDLARHHVDMLGVLEEKTRGNLDDEEEKLLKSVLYELRMQYLNVSRAALDAARQQGEEQGETPGA